MKRQLLILGLFVLLAGSAHAATVYVSQSGGSESCGADGTQATTAMGSVSWVAGNIYKLCGTITSQVAPKVSGTSASPILISFETGAMISMSSCGSTGCIYLDGLSYITIDGGTNGVIQATDSGTGMGSGDSVAIYARSKVSDCIIRNLTIANMYVHSSTSDGASNSYFGIWLDGSNNLIYNNTIHDAMAGIKVETPASGNQYYKNTIYNINWGFMETGASSSTTNGNTNEKIYNNNIYDFENWDTTADTYHHDGIFAAGGASSAEMSNFDIYDNYIHGSTSSPTTCASAASGSCMTAMIYINTANNMRDYNNVLVANTGEYVNNGWILHYIDASDSILNNTVIGGTTADGGCIRVESTTGVRMENNIMSNCNELMWTDTASTFSSIDYNTYQDPSLSAGIWDISGTNYTSFAAWQSAIGGDTHGQATTGSLGLSTSYLPQTGSKVIGVGANLTSLGITALDSDAGGNARPSTGAWSAGAYQPSTATVAPPTGLTATPH